MYLPIPSRVTLLALGQSYITWLQWRHTGHDGVSNHQPHHCLLNRVFRRRSKETSKLRVTGLCAGNSPATGEFPTQRPVTRKMFPFDDVIMVWSPQWNNPGGYGEVDLHQTTTKHTHMHKTQSLVYLLGCTETANSTETEGSSGWLLWSSQRGVMLTTFLFQWVYSRASHSPAGKWRNNNVIITPKRRRDVGLTP